jgi:hypothetical protein
MKKITLLSTRCLLMLWLGLLLTTGVRAQSANFFVYGTSTHIGDLTVLGCDDQYYLVSTFAQGTHTWTLPTGMVPASGYTVNDPVIKVTVLSAFVTSSVGHSVVYSSVTYNDSKTLTKYPPITNTLSGSVVYVCGSGNAGTITGSTPTGGMGGTYSYQWYRNNSSGYTAIPGATSKDYSPGVITETTTYYREVYQTINCNCRLSSTENITVLVVQGISITDPDGNNCHYMSYDPPVIDGQTTTGGMASPASYQWQSKVGVGGTYSNISGATSEDYNPGVLTTTTYFRRLVTTRSPLLSAHLHATLILTAAAEKENICPQRLLHTRILPIHTSVFRFAMLIWMSIRTTVSLLRTLQASRSSITRFPGKRWIRSCNTTWNAECIL